jgi:hypothetical protein
MSERLCISFEDKYSGDGHDVSVTTDHEYEHGMSMRDAYKQLTKVLHAAGFVNDVTVTFHGSTLGSVTYLKEES